MISDKAKAAILDKCCQKVDCLARGEVIDLEGAADLPQRSSPVTETVTGSWSTDQELIALCMDMLGDVPGETLDQRVEKLVSYHLELQLLHGNEVQISLNLEMELNQCRGHAQRPEGPVAWRYQRKEGWEGVWRYSSIPISEQDFESPEDWVTEPLYLSAPNAPSHLIKAALKECANRCRYDGDLFHDQGNIIRRDASWMAADMAAEALSALSDTSTVGNNK
jgi:hypothetical protein